MKKGKKVSSKRQATRVVRPSRLRRKTTRPTATRKRPTLRKAQTKLPPEQLAYQRMVVRLHKLCTRHIPRQATALVVTRGDATLLRFSKRARHFCRTVAGEYLGYHPAGDLSAVAQLEAGRAEGAQFLVLPEASFWWLDHYRVFRRHLDAHYRCVASVKDTGMIWSLTESPKARARTLTTQFADIAAEFRAATEREPVVLDCFSGPRWEEVLKGQAVFQPPSAGPLPYHDKTVDLVITSSNEAMALGEAHRVASAGVIRLDHQKQALSVEWQPGFRRESASSLSIVMPCYNGEAMTAACLRSLFETLPANVRCEVIVVDDCSQDGTAAMLKRLAKNEPRLRHFRNLQNAGFVDTCNFGAAQATGDLLVFLNNDLVLLPGWLEPLARVFRDRADAGACGGKLIFPDGTFQEAGGVIFNDGTAMNYGRTGTDLTAPEYSFLREVDYCSGALFATRRETFQRLGGFGAEYRPGYCEDSDYCFKVREAGLKVYFQPESAVVHREGGTAGTDTSKGMKRYQVLNLAKLQQRWATALTKQPARPGKLDRANLLRLAFRQPRRAVVSWYYPPEPDRDSGSRSIMDYIELLLAEGWSVTFLASHRFNEARYVQALQQRGVAVFDGSKTKADEFFRAMQFDLALLAFWPVAEIYLETLRRASPGTRILVDSGDLHLVRNARRVFNGAANRRQAGVLDAAAGTEFVRELNVYAAADACLMVSAKETELLNDLLADPRHAYTVPDVQATELSSVPLTERRGMVFMGSFRHAPNADAVEYFCREILPRLNPALLARHPLRIIGESPGEELRRLTADLRGVRLVGWTPAVEPYLERARISIVPLRYGAGTKRKLLQSMMTGTPAVSTRVGAEGFGLMDGEQVLLADDPGEFARAIERLLTDDALWEKLSTRGRAHMAAQHGREAVAERFRKVLAEVFARPPKLSASGPVTEAAPPARVDRQQYGELCSTLLAAVRPALPAKAKVAVISKGDEALLKLGAAVGWHFPQNSRGVYAGHHPADSKDAIRQLEAVRRKGAEFLLVPETSAWWLTHYAGLKQHLDTTAQETLRVDKVCTLFDLRRTVVKAGKGETSIAQQDHRARAGDPRLIAFYLPQFHPIPENDAWWGEGFTEWTNVGKAKPAFDGHHQPQLPADLGFYDLRLAEARAAQAELARAYGIHGFCYYHYWFGGKRLLERPFNDVLTSGQPDFPFCLCWANEPWSRRWDGQEQNVLQAQEYSAEDDVNHIRWLLPALQDRRAIRIEGKPVFIVYQGRELPDPARTVETWRREAAAAGLPGLYLMTVETGWDAGWDATQVGFDAKVLFAPQFTTLFNSGAQIPVPGQDKLRVFDYQKAWPVLANPAPVKYLRYETVCPAWDNSARRGTEATVMHNSTPAAYEEWLRGALARAQARPPEHRVVFLNAWNEWAEGAHLEPDLKHGHAYLEATRRALQAVTASPGRKTKGRTK